MAKKVIGIILTVVGGLSLLMALIFGLIFGGVGTAMNGVSDSAGDDIQNSNTASCYGEVLSVEDSRTVVYYVVGDEEYAVELHVSTSQYPEGSQVTVYYNSTKPEECSVPEISEAAFGTIGSVFSGLGIALVIVFGGIGIVGLIVGILLIRSAVKQKNNEN